MFYLQKGACLRVILLLILMNNLYKLVDPLFHCFTCSTIICQYPHLNVNECHICFLMECMLGGVCFLILMSLFFKIYFLARLVLERA